MSDANRFEAIEIKLAHLERSLQELGETVMLQRREIETLLARHRSMQSQLESLESSAPGGEVFEKPPHY